MKKYLQRIRFNLTYLSKPKWDTGVPAPEIIRYISGKTPGNAIDLGCGTGTNLLYLAQHGWAITGLDFAPLAIERAKKKLIKFQNTLFVADVTKLSNYELPGLYDLGLDMGCFHNLSEAGRLRYVEGLEKWIKSNGVFMVYAFQPKINKEKGISKADMIAYFNTNFDLINYEQGQGRPSAWYYFKKK